MAKMNWDRVRRESRQQRARLQPKPLSRRRPTALQLAYAQALGIDERALKGKSMAEVSRLISVRKR